jgi:HlyD family secretion protein
MINNSMRRLLLSPAFALSVGCSRAEAEQVLGYQGIVEFDQRVIGFEVAGRIAAVSVKEGDVVREGDKLAALDDAMTRSSREARAREADAAKSQVSLVQAGSRPEEIASMAARVRAAQAVEDLIRKNLTRQRELLAKEVVSQASVDDLDGQLARATAERQALAQNLSALQRGARRVEVQAAQSRADAASAAVSVDDVRLARYDLVAPRAATVLDVHAEPGEVVAAGTPVVTLGDTEHPYADVFVPQGKLAGIAVGNKARVRIDALSQPLSGSVEHIARRTEFTPRFLFSERERPNLVVRVRVRIEDPKQRLFAGVPAFVSIADKK